MGSSYSEPVSVLATGQTDSPFAIRRCPGYADGTFVNPPEYQTMQDMMKASFKKFPNNNLLGYRENVNGILADHFSFLTYSECEAVAMRFGSGLFHMGLSNQSFVGVYAENRMEWGHAINTSCLFGIVIVSLYDTFGPVSLGLIIGHSKIETILVSSKSSVKLYSILRENKLNVKRVILTDDADSIDHINRYKSMGLEAYSFSEICQIGDNHMIRDLPIISPEDLHFICYSSGTTGSPKGVKISHRSQTNNTLNCFYGLDFREDERHLSYLPLAHVFERIGISITSFVGGAIGFFSGSIPQLVNDIQVLKPTHLSAVPRVISRIYDKIKSTLETSSIIKRGIFWGMWYWKRMWIKEGSNSSIANLLVFNTLKTMLGGNLRQFIVGGAAMDPWVHEFMQIATDAPMRVGYGLTEIGAGNICNPLDIRRSKPGTVGGPMCNCEVKLTPVDGFDDPLAGEILIGGQSLCSGYLYDEEETNKLFVDSTRQWIHTGDIGKWDEDGYLMIVDRLRSIFKLAQGEYVAAELLTEIYQNASIIEQIFIYGDSTRNFLVAIVVPKKTEVEKFYNKSNISDLEFQEHCKSGDLIIETKRQIDQVFTNKKLMGFERIQKVAIESEPWTIANDLMTPTFKLKRKKLSDKYRETIHNLYIE